MKKNTFFKIMLTVGCAATLGTAAMEAQAYVHRNYGYHGGRYYHVNRHVGYRSYYARPAYTRYNYYYSGNPVYYRTGYYSSVPRCGYWRGGVWIVTRCY